MGESKGTGVRFAFNRSIRLAGRDSQLTADGGALLLREIDEGVGLTASVAGALAPRGSKARYSAAELLRVRLYLLALGYEDQSDADVLRDDPALRLAISDGRGTSPLDRDLPSQPTVSRFTSELATPRGQRALADALVSSALTAQRRVDGRIDRQVLDIDSLPLEAHGQQGGSAYNGHYRCRCFHPQVVMDGSGHLLAVKLRPGNESTSTGAWELLAGVIDRLAARGVGVSRVRGDAGFPHEDLLGALESRGIGFAFRIASNSGLERLAEPFLVRPVGRPTKQPREWTHVLSYRGKRWSRARRIVLVVQERPEDLYLHHFFIVTSDESTTGAQVLNFYRRRGTMEARLGEWVHTTMAALSSSHRDASLVDGEDDRPFRSNAATLLLSALAYNLLHLLRRLAARARNAIIGNELGLSRARRLLLTVAARVIRSGRRATMLVPHVVEHMWASVLARIRTRA
jgi:hypothetical protein